MLTRIAGFSSALLLTFAFTGCEDAPLPDSPVVEMGHVDHGGHGGHGAGHPETFAEAYAQLCELRDTVSKAFADKNSEAAHGPLHDVGHLLEEVSELGGKSDLSDEAKQVIETNVEKLLDAFGAVDKRMHDAAAGKDYSEVSEEIDAAIKAIAGAAGGLAEHGGHHDGEAHDETHGAHDGHADGHEEHGDKDVHEAHKEDHGDGEKAADHKDGDADHKDDHGDKAAATKDGDAGHKEEHAEDEKAPAKDPAAGDTKSADGDEPKEATESADNE